MLRRLNLVLFLISYAVSGLAETDVSAWNCTQTVDNEEWVCVTEPGAGAKSPSQSDTVSAPVSPAVVKLASQIPGFNFGPYVAAGGDVVSPPKTIDRTGWDCKTGADDDSDDEKWSCHLTGQDPKGLAKVVTTDGSVSSFGFSAFDIYQEQIFKRMQADFEVDPWQNCRFPHRRELSFEPDLELRDQAPLDVKADYSEIFDKEITTFTGNVEMTRADQYINVDRSTYDAVSQTMDAQGNLYYREKGLSIYSDTALLRLADDQARMRNALFILPAGRSRGSAKVVYRDTDILSRFKDVVYSTCKPENQDWALHASRLKINQETGKASTKHTRIDFYGVPVFYSPYLSFPIDDRRTSGFLSPSFGHNDDNGYDFTLPYYWNIAPNYDATFRPRSLSKRGILLAGDFRYLTESTEGEVNVEYLPYDVDTKQTRGQFAWENETDFLPGLKSVIDLNYISDDDYQDDLGGILSNFNNRFVRSRADLSYNTTGVRFKTLFENFQVIDSDVGRAGKPYRRIPQVTLDLEKTLEFNEVPIKFEMENEFVYFQRGDDDSKIIFDPTPENRLTARGQTRDRLDIITGQRLIIEPSISIPYFSAGGFIEPRLSLHHTQYWLRNSGTATKFTNPANPNPHPSFKPTLILPGSTSLNRTLPIFSVDAGLFLDRDVSLFDSPFVQTLEPRLFYRYVPFVDQDDFPDFDTSEFEFSFNQLFRGDRFNGGDRIGDANQISLGITSRLIDSESGQERLKLNLGQIFYFRDREVTLPGQAIETSNFSNIIVGVSSQITDTLSYSSLGQWSPDTNEIVRGEAFLRYRGKQQQLFNLGYRFREDNVFQGADATKQGDVSLLWPVIGEWSLFGRWLYSFEENLTPDIFFGVQKESCCWRFRILGRQEIRRVDSDPDFGIFFRLELKGLTGFGDQVESFLKKNISGYRSPKY